MFGKQICRKSYFLSINVLLHEWTGGWSSIRADLPVVGWGGIFPYFLTIIESDD